MKTRADTGASVFWRAKQAPENARALRTRTATDVVIVGGGAAGLSCAQRLIDAGRSVVLLERELCGAGASGKSSGFVTPASEIELRSLVAHRGPDEARRLWSFVSSGVAGMRETIRTNALACDERVQDSFFVATDEAGWRDAQDEHRARSQLGYESRLYARDEVADVLHTSRYFGAVRYGDTFGIDPLAFCRMLRDALAQRGADIYENSAATCIRADGVDTAAGSVDARHVVVCTDRFLPELGAMRDEIDHVQTFLGVSRPLGEAQLRSVFRDERVMVWDSELIYSYFRPIEGTRVLIGGGDLRYTYARAMCKDTTHIARRLLDRFRRSFPSVTLELEHVWSGMLGVSKDLLPVMGPDPVHASVWYTGAATGLPWAFALGQYAAERILDGRSDLDDAFSRRRSFPIGRAAQKLLSKPLSFAISHAIAKRH